MSQTSVQIFSDTENTLHGKVEDIFHMCDCENKGYVIRQDLFRLQDEFGLTFDDVEKAFIELDTDQNNKITMEEFTTGFGPVVVSFNKRRLAYEIFCFIDKEGKQYITKKNLIELKIDSQQIDYIFSKLKNSSRHEIIYFTDFQLNLDYVVALSAPLQEEFKSNFKRLKYKKRIIIERKSRCKKLWERVNNEVLLAVATIIYFADIISDVILGITYLRDSDKWHGALTLLFVTISHIACSINTHFEERRAVSSWKLELLHKLKCFLLPPPIHMFALWKHTRDKWGDSRYLLYLDLTELRESTSLIELFFESIPQLCLQSYIILATQGYITTLQIVTCSISLLAASYGTVCEFDGFFVKCLVFVTSILWLFTRVVVIAMLGCIRTYIPFIFVISNWFIFVLLRTEDLSKFSTHSYTILKSYLLFAAKCSFLPIYSLRTFEVATFLILGNGIAFGYSAKFGTIKSYTQKYILVDATASTSSTWLSPNDTDVHQGMNKTLSSKHNTSNVLLSEWEYFQPLMIVFIVCSILAILPHAINFVLLVIKPKYHVELYSLNSSNKFKDDRMPLLLKLKLIKEIKELMKLNGINNLNEFYHYRQTIKSEILRDYSARSLIIFKEQLGYDYMRRSVSVNEG